MGGYPADAIAANRDMWIVAMLVGYTSGASIVYLIPVGLIMLNRTTTINIWRWSAMALISIPFAVLIALVTITFNNLPVRRLSPPRHLPRTICSWTCCRRCGCCPRCSPCVFLLALGLKLRRRRW